MRYRAKDTCEVPTSGLTKVLLLSPVADDAGERVLLSCKHCLLHVWNHNTQTQASNRAWLGSAAIQDRDIGRECLACDQYLAAPVAHPSCPRPVCPCMLRLQPYTLQLYPKHQAHSEAPSRCRSRS